MLILVASDSLNENYTKIVVNIKDVNDLPPVFPQKHYEKTMDEEMNAPFKIMQVLLSFYSFIYLKKKSHANKCNV